jgi:hypothetical protein
MDRKEAFEFCQENEVQIDRSGVGHCWKNVDEDDANLSEVADWIAEDKPESGEETEIHGIKFRVR